MLSRHLPWISTLLLVAVLLQGGLSKPDDLSAEILKSKTSFLETDVETTFKGDLKAASVHSHGKVVVCYVGTWANYRPGEGKYDLLDKFKPELCTHLIYSFAGLDNVTDLMKPLDPYLDLEEEWGKGWYKKTASFKNTFPHLKVLLAIGGWNEGSEKYSLMAADPAKRATFVNSAFDTVTKYGFDGLDLDWEFPGSRGGKSEDKQHFTTLVRELRQKFDKKNLMITAAFGASEKIAGEAYELAELSRLLDHIHIMCYDFHGSWDKVTGHNAPLFAPKGNYSIEHSVSYFLSQGVQPEKLVLGLPLYGRTFLLADDSIPGGALEVPAKDSGFQGPYTREDGFLGYNEICKELATNRGHWTTYWDDYAKVPFMRSGSKWVGFDNVKSLSDKIEFALSKGLRGAMVWSMDTDDFLSTCGGAPYPLLRAINYALTVEEKKQRQKPTKKPEFKKGSASNLANSFVVLLINVIFAQFVRLYM